MVRVRHGHRRGGDDRRELDLQKVCERVHLAQVEGGGAGENRGVPGDILRRRPATDHPPPELMIGTLLVTSATTSLNDIVNTLLAIFRSLIPEEPAAAAVLETDLIVKLLVLIVPSRPVVRVRRIEDVHLVGPVRLYGRIGRIGRAVERVRVRIKVSLALRRVGTLRARELIRIERILQVVVLVEPHGVVQVVER